MLRWLLNHDPAKCPSPRSATNRTCRLSRTRCCAGCWTTTRPSVPPRRSSSNRTCRLSVGRRAALAVGPRPGQAAHLAGAAPVGGAAAASAAAGGAARGSEVNAREAAQPLLPAPAGRDARATPRPRRRLHLRLRRLQGDAADLVSVTPSTGLPGGRGFLPVLKK